MRLSPRYKKALYSLCYLTVLASIPLVSDVMGYEIVGLEIASAMAISLLALTLLTLFFAVRETFNVREFLRVSNVRWRYSKEEWSEIIPKMKEYYHGESEFIFIFYMLTALLLATVMGLMLQNLSAFFVMLGLGFVTSMGLALISFCCNHRELQSKKRHPQPSALGEGEFLYNDLYFLENSRKDPMRKLIKSARLFKSGDRTYLKITTEEDTISWKGIGRIRQEYDLLIPSGKLKDVKSIVDRIPSKA
jgi:hypothetical protein